MPVDRLELLSDRVRWPYLRLAREKGKRSGGYSHFIYVPKTEAGPGVRLYCDGRYGGVHKIQFENVAHLGLRMVQKIAEEILGDLRHVKIYRIDVCVDICGISLLDL